MAYLIEHSSGGVQELTTLDVTLYPIPDAMKCHHLPVDVGSTIADMIPDERDALVYVGGVYVAREWWPHVRPKAGTQVVIRSIPGATAVVGLVAAGISAWAAGAAAAA